MSAMASLASPQKITFAEMRESGLRGLLVYCADYRCSHSVAFGGEAAASLSRGLFAGSVYEPHSRRLF